ncbi:MAG: hypothetical protein IKJ43_01135 [Bacilli bacterium]|nr:hypothetical protein [Bacilli bacterium]
MSEENFRQGIELLKYISEKGQEALIDADKVEILCNNKWISAGTFGIKQMPIIFSAEKINEDDQNKIIYKLNYRLLIPNINISSKKEEYIILEKDKEEGFIKKYRTLPNQEYEEEDKVRYNNEGINTFSKAKNASVILSYIAKNGRLLYEISTIIPKKSKNKKLTKKVS